eukprot:756732-Hanusia_phi.AAC.2
MDKAEYHVFQFEQNFANGTSSKDHLLKSNRDYARNVMINNRSIIPEQGSQLVLRLLCAFKTSHTTTDKCMIEACTD